MMEYIIKHNPSKLRFECECNGHVAYTEYRIYNGYIDIIHTFVPWEIEGRGIASDLVRETFDFAIKHGYSVKATCTYAAHWLKRHPIYIEEFM